MGTLSKQNVFLRTNLGQPLPQDDVDLVRTAVDSTSEELTIFIALVDIGSIDRTTGWSQMQRRVAELYTVAFGRALRSQTCATIDIVLLDFCAYSSEDMAPFAQCKTLVSAKDKHAIPTWWPASIALNLVVYPQPSTLSESNGQQSGSATSSSTRLPVPWTAYPHVALGGTFDHLHVGHKILLTGAALAATKRIVCGISAETLLEKKKYKEQLESYRVRELNVLLFLRKIRKDIIFELSPLYDQYGPTATDASIEALVVSHETLSSSNSLNVRRAEHGMPSMQLLPIDLVVTPQIDANRPRSDSDDYRASVSSENSALKISSTAIRASLAEKQSRH
ncbi:hypothetical protein IW140_002585 [Coemansia sp. RSA 1813]|nr:hypothetical protein LPJ74_001243 [Coemansia sp. RSA 1843]KAJ2216128.1 hypothetical protein EV179_001588 [Coemansia sp. RSA 487]KAJ2570115.1 hypothetical protein IW140_002585 [Coemansia sp. RSA 1813]